MQNEQEIILFSHFLEFQVYSFNINLDMMCILGFGIK